MDICSSINELVSVSVQVVPNTKVCGANMGPIWGRQDPGGPHVVAMNFAIWGQLDLDIFIGTNEYLGVTYHQIYMWWLKIGFGYFL